MKKFTVSRATGKSSKVELVVDRKVVDHAYIDAENPIAFFSAEFVELDGKGDEGETLEETVAKKKRESNIKKAEALLSEFFRLLATINETDPEVVEELLDIFVESIKESKAGTGE